MPMTSGTDIENYQKRKKAVTISVRQELGHMIRTIEIQRKKK